MITFESTSLWRRTLATQPNDEHSQERERLRSAIVSFRERAALVAAEIAHDLPDYTVHDVTHLDALWQLADVIAGPDYELTPTEAFVLGGAFLTHDLGNGLAAYPDGVKAMYESATWRDALSLILRRKFGRAPTPEEIRNADETTKKAATGQVLRTLHAQQAERLALVSWKDPNRGNQLFLIQDEFLRNNYGRLIGRIAHSHWWNVDKLKPEFEALIGAPVTCPAAWTVDPLKLACLLRVADAAHLDARRAPAFLKAIRQPSGESLEHWSFQEKLQQPIPQGDRIIYSSAQPFEQTEATAWWLCFDTLQALDRELAGVDAILADCSRHRFAIKGVQGAEEALRLSRWVKTNGWAPVDTRIRVTDVAGLASRLGGSQLYGEDNLVPLRELLQNAGDAIRARRFLQNKPEDSGEITVRLGDDAEGNWIEVSDNGIGMSEAVMTGPLLDFGAPFWNSERMTQELPSLVSSGFEPTGKYGIGFFSLFMWGSRVRVTSRGYREGAIDTRILEFEMGLRSRPILRKAAQEEFLDDGGSAVRIWVGPPPECEKGILFRAHRARNHVEDICEWLCPASDTNIFVQRGREPRKLIVQASDWKTMDGEKLLRRLVDEEVAEWALEQRQTLIPQLALHLTALLDPMGNVVGRAAIVPGKFAVGLGAVTEGGLRVCDLERAAGILQGRTVKASRDVAIPLVGLGALSRWASVQRSLLEKMETAGEGLYFAANTIAYCGESTGSLPIARGIGGWLTQSDIRSWKTLPDEIFLLEENVLSTDFGPVKLEGNVLVMDLDDGDLVDEFEFVAWPSSFAEEGWSGSRSTLSTLVGLLAERWSSTPKDVSAAYTRASHKAPNVRLIGTADGKPIKRSVNILRNPHVIKPLATDETNHKREG